MTGLGPLARAIGRLLVLLLAFLIVYFLVVFSLRQHGLSQQYAPLRHPLYYSARQSRPMVVVAHQGGGLEAPPNTIAGWDHAQALSPEIWLHVDIQQCADNWVAFGSEWLQGPTNGNGRVLDQPLARLRELDAGYGFARAGEYVFRGQGLRLLSLDQVLERYPEGRLVLDIHSNLKDIHKNIAAIVRRHHAQDRVLLQSDHDVILATLKELEPLWLFGSGTRDQSRAHLLAQLGLEPIAPLAADVMIYAWNWYGRPAIPTNLVSEVHRRQKLIFLSQVNDAEGLATARRLQVDGVWTDRPTEIWPLLRAGGG